MFRRALPLLASAQVLAGVAAIAAGLAASPRTCDPERLATMHATMMASCPCDTAVSRGQFATCARHAVADAVQSGTLPTVCRRFARRMVSRSSCGRPGFVTCCRPHLPPTAVCTVLRDAAACAATGGCVGGTSTCFGACTAGCGSPEGAFVDPW